MLKKSALTGFAAAALGIAGVLTSATPAFAFDGYAIFKDAQPYERTFSGWGDTAEEARNASLNSRSNFAKALGSKESCVDQRVKKVKGFGKLFWNDRIAYCVREDDKVIIREEFSGKFSPEMKEAKVDFPNSSKQQGCTPLWVSWTNDKKTFNAVGYKMCTKQSNQD